MATDDLLQRLKGRKKQLYDYLIENPDGAYTDDIIKDTNMSKAALYSTVYCINIGDNGISIINKCGTYYLKYDNPEYKPKKNNTENKPVIPKEIKKIVISLPLLEKIKKLPVNDMNDVLDMYKKAYYYQKSAEALIEANEQAASLIDQLSY